MLSRADIYTQSCTCYLDAQGRESNPRPSESQVRRPDHYASKPPSVTGESRYDIDRLKIGDVSGGRLVEEVHEIGDTLEQLRAKMKDVDEALRQLQQTRQTLEYDLSVKNNSIHVDRELCLSWRNSYHMAPRRSIHE